MRPAVTMAGAGVVAPGGRSVDELWSSLLAGASFAEPYVDDRLPADARFLVGRVAPFAGPLDLTVAEERRLDRAHLLAIAAAEQAIADYGAELPASARRAIVCGVGLGTTATAERSHVALRDHGLRGLGPLTIPMMMPTSTAAVLALRLGFAGPCLTVSTACASGATAIGEAVELLRSDRADLVLAGGVDAMVTYSALCAFARLGVMSAAAEPPLGCRPFDVDRDGFVMGEGAGFVVLVRSGDAPPADRLAIEVAGYGTSADAYHLITPDPSGAGVVASVRAALADAGMTAADVGHVNAHGTGTVAGDLAEATAARALFGYDSPPVTAIKGTTGHCVGGSGAIEAVVTARSLRCRLVPPVTGLRAIDPKVDVDAVVERPRPVDAPVGLSISQGFGGANAALVLVAL